MVAVKKRGKDNILRTYWMRLDKDPKLRKKKKLHTLMRSYNKVLRKVNADISSEDETKSLAALAVKLMMYTGIRIGNEASAQGIVSKVTKKVEKTQGLITLDKQHIELKGDSVVFDFVGKKRVPQIISITNPELRKQVMNAHHASTDRLIPLTYHQVNMYIRKNIGKQYSPKDFRGLRANLEAVKKIAEISRRPKPETKTQANEEIKEVAEHVANVLGNTLGVAKRSYIDSNIIVQMLHARFNPKKKRKK